MNEHYGKKEAGFTLIEITMVLVLIGILAAIAAPKYFDMQEEAEKNAALGSIAEAQARLESVFGRELLNGKSCTDARTTATQLESFVDDASGGKLGDFFIKKDGEWSGETGAVTVSNSQGKSLELSRSYLVLPVCNGDSTDQATVVKQTVQNDIMTIRKFINKLLAQGTISGSDGTSVGAQDIFGKIGYAKTGVTYTTQVDGQTVEATLFTYNEYTKSSGVRFTANINGTTYTIQEITESSTIQNVYNAMNGDSGNFSYFTKEYNNGTPTYANNGVVYYTTTSKYTSGNQQASVVAMSATSGDDGSTVGGMWSNNKGITYADGVQITQDGITTGSAYK